MAETPEELHRRAVEQGLRMPPLDEWETFPFEGEMRPRELLPPVEREPPRRGEEGPCWRCERGDADAVWSDERWLLTPLAEPSGLPAVVVLQPRLHCDLDSLPPDLAAELGPLIVRVHDAVASVPHVGRVHVGRWGDGSYHLHWWFMARPARLPQLVGSFAAIWDDVLPPTPEDVWRENLATIAAAMGR